MTDFALQGSEIPYSFGEAYRSQPGKASAAKRSGVMAGSLPNVLQSICQPQVSLAIWQRRLPLSIQQRMAALCVLMPRHEMTTLSPGAPTDPALDKVLRGFHGTPVDARDAWRTDLQLLIALARNLAPQALLRVHIETRACNPGQQFHVDHAALRLICTYRGQGTQWLPKTAFDRCASAGESNARIRDWSALQEIPSGAVAVMKGNRFPDQPGQGLLHRSPSASVAAPRVLAMVDIDFV